MERAQGKREIERLVAPVLELCRRAGEVILSRYHSAGAEEYDLKEDLSPLTAADMRSHDILVPGLEALTPALPVLSEESADIALETRLAWNAYWLVDPLDGTKEFLSRTGEFTINIALIEAGAPRLGVLYQPLRRLAHAGIPGGRALSYDCGGAQPRRLRVLHTRRLDRRRPLRVLASRRHRGRRIDACLSWLEQRCGGIERVNSGSALKFCQLADGEGDLYPRFSPCSEWDIAAGQAILEAAGGSLVTLRGRPVVYNRRRSLLSPAFYAIADPEHELWRELLAQQFA